MYKSYPTTIVIAILKQKTRFDASGVSSEKLKTFGYSGCGSVKQDAERNNCVYVYVYVRFGFYLDWAPEILAFPLGTAGLTLFRSPDV